MTYRYFIISGVLLLSVLTQAQDNYWQQNVQYTMDIEMDTKKHQFTGDQRLVYSNNSPDTLDQVFYHLYFNAFQPGSMLAERTAFLPDPDSRMKGRFEGLKADEIGYHKINSLKHNSSPVDFKVVGTVLQVKLNQPILPGAVDTFHMTFESQVPVQIRRSGRNNKEGVDYTMTQWYPKMAAYDKDGWHPDQYVGREFYGDFGDFDVKISIDSDYIIGGTGEEIGALEENEPKTKKSKKSDKRTWHFTAKNVHDFAWAADPDFTHESFKIENGPTINLYYRKKTANVKNWQSCHDDIRKYFAFMAKHYGKYAYPQFSLIQGGDGGMEYPMCTMMLGGGKSYEGFFGLFVHEATHSWYYGMLASNEQKYPWIDEGFTSYAEAEVMDHVFEKKMPNPHLQAVERYLTYVKSGGKATMAAPGDHFVENRDYSINAYIKGELFLVQLKHIIGAEAFEKTMLSYYAKWKFKHPGPKEFLKVAEDESGIQLDWFLTYWTQLEHVTDYAIASVSESPEGAVVTLQKNRNRPMPVDVAVKLNDGTFQFYTIPLVSMYGHKEENAFKPQEPWPWTRTEYTLNLPINVNDIEVIVIDPLLESGDVDIENNMWKPEEN